MVTFIRYFFPIHPWAKMYVCVGFLLSRQWVSVLLVVVPICLCTKRFWCFPVMLFPFSTLFPCLQQPLYCREKKNKIDKANSEERESCVFYSVCITTARTDLREHLQHPMDFTLLLFMTVSRRRRPLCCSQSHKQTWSNRHVNFLKTHQINVLLLLLCICASGGEEHVL